MGVFIGISIIGVLFTGVLMIAMFARLARLAIILLFVAIWKTAETG